MIWHFESAGQEFYPTYWLCKLAASEVDVLIGGYGNDGIWGCCPRLPPSSNWRRHLSLFRTERRYLQMRQQLPFANMSRLLPSCRYSNWTLLRRLSRFAIDTGHELNDFIFIDGAVYGEQVVNRELGKVMLEAHSICPRMPYLDDSLCKIANSLPPDMKRAVIPTGRLEQKHFFKEVMRKNGILPSEIIFRKKTWMATPTAEWLRNTLGDEVQAILLGKHAHVREYFDMAQVERCIREHRSGIANHTSCLMTVTSLELFHGIFIDAPRVSRPDTTLGRIARGNAG